MPESARGNEGKKTKYGEPRTEMAPKLRSMQEFAPRQEHLRNPVHLLLVATSLIILLSIFRYLKQVGV